MDISHKQRDVPELDLKYRTSKGDIKLVGGQVITIERLHKKEDNTEHYQWLLSSKDFKRKHQIDVEHQTFWGKVIVAIDGIEVYNHTKFVDAGGSFIFDIEKIPCVLNVVDETSHFTYHLTVSGLTIEPLDESKDATSQEQNLKESTVGGAHKLVPYESSSKSASEVVAYDQLTDEPSISR